MNAQEVNQLYLNSMLEATESSNKVLWRVRELWWPHFLEFFGENKTNSINQLDIAMGRSRDLLREQAENYAFEKIGNRDSDQYRQRISQFLKSNTGKMFERFIGLAIAYYLLKEDSEYAIWPFRNDLSNVSNHLNKEHFNINCQLGNTSYITTIDSDLIVFTPEDGEKDFYMLSIKSTLKDRFHNVPFWNLLRVCAVNNIHGLSAVNQDILSRAKYVAACTDLAEEQPDFAGHDGPRNLLCVDAAILDGAYVTCSTARGLGSDENHFGENRAQAFYQLSKFLEMLCETA